MTTVETGPDYTLTDPGWPRPNIGGYPIPWVAPAENLSEVNEGRRLSSIGGSVCQVCGLSFGFGEDAYAFIEATLVARRYLRIDEFISTAYAPGATVVPLDGAVLHHHCARLTAVACPHIRERSDLIMVEVPANDAEPIHDAEGILRPSYRAGDVRYVNWPSSRQGD